MAENKKSSLYCQIDARVHTKAKIYAAKKHLDLQDVVEEALKQFLTGGGHDNNGQTN